MQMFSGPRDQHIGRHRQLHPRRRRQQRAIVAHAQCVARHRALEEALDQLEFTHDRIVTAAIAHRKTDAGDAQALEIHTE
jgi:hypothetical protein